MFFIDLDFALLNSPSRSLSFLKGSYVEGVDNVDVHHLASLEDVGYTSAFQRFSRTNNVD
ncbi:hypothetical protein BVRB_1g012520 [Beta vulgaris subsp. vulgaris]|nr:hypothetical protein BVRB_1g012520 [Beta vulgaris subsp. vulgaris]